MTAIAEASGILVATGVVRTPVGLTDTLAREVDGVFDIGADAATAIAGGVVFIGALVVLALIGRLVVLPIVRRMLDRRGLDEHTQRPLLFVSRVVVWFVAFAVAFGIAGFGNFLVSMVGIAAAATLAIGFAMQSVIANFVAGVFIVKDEPFRVGDRVEWNGNAGVVREIQLRVTKLDTADNELVTVPNAELANSALVNPNGNEQLRISYDFGISYDDDIAHAKDVIADEAKRVVGALPDPAPDVAVADLGDSAVVLSGRLWIDPRAQSPAGVQATFIEAVKNRFDAEGIDMPYPHSELTGELTLAEQADARIV